MNKHDQEFLVQKIRTQYTEKEHTRLDELKELDSKVKKPVNIFAYIFGTLGAMVMGSGMSLVMTDIGAQIGVAQPLIPGIIIGIGGMIIALVNYPIHQKLMGARRRKYAPQIIALSEKLMEE